MTIELAREIVKVSLSKYHGCKYDKAVDSIEFHRDDFNDETCFYTNGDNRGDNIYIVLSIKGDLLYLNTNLLQIKWFYIENGREYNHSVDDTINFNKKGIPKYNQSISDIIKEIRDNKINKILI